MSAIKKLGDLVEASVSDIAAFLTGSPPTALGGKTLSYGIGLYAKKLAETAQQIMLQELRSGKRLAGDFGKEIDSENFFALMFQYLNAVKIGAANRNLKLMAQLVINGSVAPIPFQPDEVASISRYVADLDPEEIVLLAELQRQCDNFANYTDGDDQKKIAINTMLFKELIPKVFATNEDLMLVATSLQRTGLIVLPNTWDGNRIDASPRFHKLVRLVDLQSTDEANA